MEGRYLLMQEGTPNEPLVRYQDLAGVSGAKVQREGSLDVIRVKRISAKSAWPSATGASIAGRVLSTAYMVLDISSCDVAYKWYVGLAAVHRVLIGKTILLESLLYVAQVS